jgi:hypothetical protein
MIVSFPARKEGMILCLDNVLDENLCHELVGKLQPMYEEVAQDGKTVGGVMYNVKRSSDLTLSESTFTSHSSPWDSRFAAIEMAIFDAFHTAVASYRDIYRHTQDWTSVADTGYQIQKYHRNDGYYREHVDSFPSENPEMAARVLAGIVYLNDVKHGGQTNFPLHGACIEPAAGRIVLFPATFTHPHEACTPLSDDKWIISTFFINKQQTAQVHDHPHPHPH